MADGKELKPKSYRLYDETSEKFKKISNELGCNQDQTMNLLLNAYYMQEQKAELPEHKASLDEFEVYATNLIAMYTHSLQASHNMEERVRSEFYAQLESKDSIIRDLQEKLSSAEQEKKDAKANADTLTDENLRLNDVIASLKEEYNSKMDDMQDMLKDKESMLEDKKSLNKALNDTCNAQKQQLEELRKEHENAVALEEENKSLQKKIEDLGNALAKKDLEHKEELLDLDKKLFEDYRQKLDSQEQKQQTAPKKTATRRKTPAKTAEKAEEKADSGNEEK